MICKRCALIGVHRLFFCIFPITSEKQTEAKREPVGSQTEAKRELIGRQTEPHSNVFWTFPEKKIEKACLYEKEFLSLHPLNSNRVDPLAQLVEHNTFNVGVLGSSPKRITDKVATSRCNLFLWKNKRDSGNHDTPWHCHSTVTELSQHHEIKADASPLPIRGYAVFGSAGPAPCVADGIARRTDCVSLTAEFC